MAINFNCIFSVCFLQKAPNFREAPALAGRCQGEIRLKACRGHQSLAPGLCPLLAPPNFLGFVQATSEDSYKASFWEACWRGLGGVVGG